MFAALLLGFVLSTGSTGSAVFLLQAFVQNIGAFIPRIFRAYTFQQR